MPREVSIRLYSNEGKLIDWRTFTTPELNDAASIFEDSTAAAQSTAQRIKYKAALTRLRTLITDIDRQAQMLELTDATGSAMVQLGMQINQLAIEASQTTDN